MSASEHTMPSIELQELAENLLDDLMARFPLRKRPELIWKSLRVTAGIAYYRVNRIGLSHNLIVDPDRLSATLIHEYAHLMAFERHGSRAANHGPAWKQAMTELGAEPKRTHCYEVKRNSARQSVTYLCQKCGVKFERARRLPRRRKYAHAGCGGSLKLIAVERTMNEPSMP